jgi:hypothetical protein
MHRNSQAARAPRRALIVLFLCCGALSTGCASLRPDACAQRAMAGPDYQSMNDKLAHCLASAKITLACGARYARFAGVGKEWLDALGAGDASREDLRANGLGRECAAKARAAVDGVTSDGIPSDAALTACCEDALR